MAACATSSATPAQPAPAPPPVAQTDQTAQTAQTAQTEQPADAPRSQAAWLGVWFDTGTTRVIRVVEKSPAARAGLEVGDEIVSLDGVAMHASQQIVKTVSAAPPGSRVQVALTRADKPVKLTIELAARPSDDRLLHDMLVGRPAPAFSTTAMDGRTPVALADLRDKVVLVEFWASWCGPCTMQFSHLNQWHRRYANRGLRIVALSDEEPDLLREYARAKQLTYPIALDPGDRIRVKYHVTGLPATVIIDRSGVVRYVTVGVADPAEIESVITRLLK